MTKDDILKLEGRELDVAVAERVMGRQIVGWTTCVYVDGDWSIHPDTDIKGWGCYAEHGPVYLDRCVCEHASEISTRFANHITTCLEVVPTYSSDMNAAWQVVEKMKADNYTLQLQVNELTSLAAFFLGGLKDEQVQFVSHKDERVAILRAALLATLDAQ